MVVDPKAKSRRNDPGVAEGGALKLREPSPRSSTASLPGSTRLKSLGHAAFQ